MKKIIVIALVGLLFGGILFWLLNNYIYSEKQADIDSVPGQIEVELEGEVVNTDLEAMAADGPAIITLKTNVDEEVKIAIPSMGRNLCAAADAIGEPAEIEVGDLVRVSGTFTESKMIVPCEREDHYLEIYERVDASDVGVSFNYRKGPSGYILETNQSALGDDVDFVRSYSLTRITDVREPLPADFVGEGPPMIQLQVYENTENLSPNMWIAQKPQVSNIALAQTEPIETNVAGKVAYQYRADGLYVTDYYVVQNDNHIYVFTAANGNVEASLMADLGQLLKSVNFEAKENMSDSEQSSENDESTTFVGNLEEVNTSCLADGECSVTVSGKKVITLIGWNREVVGSVVGVEGFADLTDHLGVRVEVYAQELGDGVYTLYGNNNYYVKLLDEVGFSTKIGQTDEAFDIQIRPLSVLNDSRCPSDVTCIQAGTVEVETEMQTRMGNNTQTFTLGQVVTTEMAEITLVRVDPVPNSETTITNSEYVFHFKVRSL